MARFPILFLFLLFIPFFIHAQEAKSFADSLQQRQLAMRQRMDSLRRANDSLLEVYNREAARRSMEEMSRNTRDFVAAQRERERKEEQRTLIRLGGATVLLVLLILYRKKKGSTKR